MIKSKEEHRADFDKFWKEESLRNNESVIGMQNAFDLWLKAKDQIYSYSVATTWKRTYSDSTHTIIKNDIVKARSEAEAFGLVIFKHKKKLKEYDLELWAIREIEDIEVVFADNKYISNHAKAAIYRAWMHGKSDSINSEREFNKWYKYHVEEDSPNVAEKGT